MNAKQTQDVQPGGDGYWSYRVSPAGEHSWMGVADLWKNGRELGSWVCEHNHRQRLKAMGCARTYCEIANDKLANDACSCIATSFGMRGGERCSVHGDAL